MLHCVLSLHQLYLIPFLHQTTTLRKPPFNACSCILFHFYIKPQLYGSWGQRTERCILFHFYIKPQHKCVHRVSFLGCILFHFYIKPQPNSLSLSPWRVVSYSISTSNHNTSVFWINASMVVSYSISTSNHNVVQRVSVRIVLYLIPFLHQTTTGWRAKRGCSSCILFHFYIKPQPLRCKQSKTQCCILFHFYIKPQLMVRYLKAHDVVSYSISTSNHNMP